MFHASSQEEKELILGVCAGVKPPGVAVCWVDKDSGGTEVSVVAEAEVAITADAVTELVVVVVMAELVPWMASKSLRAIVAFVPVVMRWWLAKWRRRTAAGIAVSWRIDAVDISAKGTERGARLRWDVA